MHFESINYMQKLYSGMLMARLKSRHAIVTFKARLVTIAAKIYMVFEVLCLKEFLGRVNFF